MRLCLTRNASLTAGLIALVQASGCAGSSDGEPLGGSGGQFSSGGMSPDGSGGSGGASDGSGGLASGGNLGSGGEGVVSSSGGASTVGGVPSLLSATGLFAADGVTLADGVRAFEPQFKLWTDSAEKRRWIYLPPGSQIDTTNMDYWEFPPGTKLWKEFSRDGTRVETRLLYKSESGSWKMMAYLWREDQKEADAVPDGMMNARSTDHDVPSATLCADCHAKVDDRVLGFSAVQLAKTDGSGAFLSLNDLKTEGLLSVNPGDIVVPGDATAQAALGYLHANCGHCHNPKSSVAGQVPMYLWLNVSELGAVEDTQTYLTTVNQDLSKGTGPVGVTHRIKPGDLVASAIYARMDSRGPDYSMPPLGTEDVDAEGLKAVEDWIKALAQ